jgi:hypothetical protein
MSHFTIKRLPEPDHPRDLSGTAHRPHVITSTAFNAWHNGRYPEHAEAVHRRLEARHVEQAPPSEYVWLIGTGGVLVDEGTLRTTHGAALRDLRACVAAGPHVAREDCACSGAERPLLTPSKWCEGAEAPAPATVVVNQHPRSQGARREAASKSSTTG